MRWQVGIGEQMFHASAKGADGFEVFESLEQPGRLSPHNGEFGLMGPACVWPNPNIDLWRLPVKFGYKIIEVSVGDGQQYSHGESVDNGLVSPVTISANACCCQQRYILSSKFLMCSR